MNAVDGIYLYQRTNENIMDICSICGESNESKLIKVSYIFLIISLNRAKKLIIAVSKIR